MISKAKIAYIRSLHNKSDRHSEWLFLVEWMKCMNEFIDSDFEIVEGFFTEKFLEDKNISFPYELVTGNELSRITTLGSNDAGVLVVRMRQKTNIQEITPTDTVIVLDTINDPWNLGTIIRIADWYGISHIVASSDTVDCYNPKVLMATMWSFARVHIYYTDIDQYLSKIDGTIYGAYLEWESVHTKKFSKWWSHIVIGSEAHGISSRLESYITDKITIPRFGNAESLNAGVATAIIVDRIIGSIK